MNNIEQRLEAKIDEVASAIRAETQAGFNDLGQFTEFVVERSEGKLREEMRQGFSQVEARFGAVDARFDVIDARFNAIERRFDRLEERLFRDR